MGQRTQSIRTPGLVVGDFDAEPHELEKTGWPNLVDGIICPADDDTSCHEGGRAHSRLRLKLKLKLGRASRWVLPLTEWFAHPPMPKTQKDLESKHSRRLRLQKKEQ
eukprot:4128333-Pyramimonas_sp.AAC.1